MKITREKILSNTNCGINIFAFILKQYYPGETVLSLSGKDCEPTKNPFNNDRKTLKIKITDGIACYLDLENELDVGDVFDFATKHYQLESEKLLFQINKDLHLKIGENAFYNGPKITYNYAQEFRPPLPVFSYFSKPISNIRPKKTIDLYDLYNEIKGTRYIESTETLRQIKDSKEARKYKSLNFDYVTFSGTFSKRNDKELIKHSGLLTLDFDHINDLTVLRDALLSDPYIETEMLFTSPSGHGIKWIIQVDLSEVNHQEYFKAVSNYIIQTYGLEVDQSGKDISRACFLSYDPKVYINPKYH